MQQNRLGVVYSLDVLVEKGPDKLLELVDLGAECVQIQSFNPKLYTRENAEKVRKDLDGKIAISSFWAGWTGPMLWNFEYGPQTLGLIPAAYRFGRYYEVYKGISFAEWLGVTDVATHVGFIPEDPSTAEYRSSVIPIKQLAGYAKEKGIHFNFETGQETPVTLMRMITDIDNDYAGINLDPANLIMYGKGNPVDALDVFEGRVRGVHVKDGDYTKNFYELGQERVVGEGSVNFPVFLPKLLRQGYCGDLYIEREISGEQQIIDIKKTFTYVRKILSSV